MLLYFFLQQKKKKKIKEMSSSSSRTVIGFLLVGGIGYALFVRNNDKKKEEEEEYNMTPFPMLNYDDYNGNDNLHGIHPYTPQTYGHISSTKKVHADPVMTKFMNTGSQISRENLLFTGSNGKKLTRIEYQNDHDRILYGYPSYDYSVSKTISKKYKNKFF